MTEIDRIVAANAEQPAPPVLPTPPSRKLAIVTCMDSRIDVFGAFGLQLGEAHVIRNAGGLPTDDVLRSLAISQRALGTREIAVIHHTRCGMEGLNDAEFRAQLSAETGITPPWDVPGFSDVLAQAARSAEVVRSCPWIPHRDVVRGFVLDVETGRLTEAG